MSPSAVEVAHQTLPAGRCQLAELEAALAALAACGAPGALALVRQLGADLERQEARHVRAALRDEAFGFAAAQAELARLRGRFAELCRELVRGGGQGLEPAARREVLDLAYLIKCAPLTDEEDLAALRRARRARAG